MILILSLYYRQEIRAQNDELLHGSTGARNSRVLIWEPLSFPTMIYSGQNTLNIRTYSKTWNRLKDFDTKPWGGGSKGEALEGGVDWQIEIGIYTLLCMELISNKDLLYSSEKCIQYSVIGSYGERIWKKMDIYVYVWLIHITVHLKLMTYTP